MSGGEPAGEPAGEPVGEPVDEPAAARGEEQSRYGRAFEESGVPMAVATMDGCFVDCNRPFREASLYSLEELTQLTIFNLTKSHDLQDTFAHVAEMLRAKGDDAPSFTARAVRAPQSRTCPLVARSRRTLAAGRW